MVKMKLNDFVKLLAVAAILGIASSSEANNVGTTGAAFLKIGLGARPAALGGSYVAVADDLNAIHYNPAGLSQLDKTEVSATYLNYFQDINYGFVAGAVPVTDLGVFGVSVAYLMLDGIETRAENEQILDTNAGANDLNVVVSYAKADIVSGLSAGINAKLISEKIVSHKALTFAADIGALHSGLIDNLNLGLAVQNLGPGLKFIDERDPLPINIKIGAAYRMLDKALLVSADADYYVIDQKAYVQFGAEYAVMEMIYPRVGYRVGGDLGSLAGLGAGIGFRLPVGDLNIGLDYAFTPSYGDLGKNGHRITILAKF